MALDYLPFMGILIVYSLEALLFLEQRFERTEALPISEREIQNNILFSGPFNALQ